MGRRAVRHLPRIRFLRDAHQPGAKFRRVLITVEALILIGGMYVGVFLLRAVRAAPRALNPERVAELQDEVRSLQRRYAEHTAGDSLRQVVEAEGGDALLVLRTSLVQEIATWAAHGYLDDVRLHVTPDAVVEEGGEVRTGVGPVKIRAGAWNIEVAVREVDAHLRADSIALAVQDSMRMSIALAVAVTDARGSADIHFEWDASTVGSVVCRDFEIRERFNGVIAPFTYYIGGAFRFEGTPDGLMAVPEFARPSMRIRPEPTGESWERVSGLLDHQNNVFRCGLGLQPDELMLKLQALLAEGFDFRLPEVLFRPIRIPTLLDNAIEVRGQDVRVIVEPRHVRMTPEAIWYSTTLVVGG